VPWIFPALIAISACLLVAGPAWVERRRRLWTAIVFGLVVAGNAVSLGSSGATWQPAGSRALAFLALFGALIIGGAGGWLLRRRIAS